MKYRNLGNTGLIVSELALGTMQFGRKMNMGNLGPKETEEFISFAIDQGINMIDTADVYSQGESEEFVGAVIMRSLLVSWIRVMKKSSRFTEGFGE